MPTVIKNNFGLALWAHESTDVLLWAFSAHSIKNGYGSAFLAQEGITYPREHIVPTVTKQLWLGTLSPLGHDVPDWAFSAYSNRKHNCGWAILAHKNFGPKNLNLKFGFCI